MIITEDFILNTPHLYTVITAINYYGVEWQENNTAYYTFRKLRYADMRQNLTEAEYTQFRKLPERLEIDMSAGFSVIDFSLMCRVLRIVKAQYKNRDDYCRVCLYMLNKVLYFRNTGHYGNTSGYVVTVEVVAKQLRVSESLVRQTIDKMLDEKILTRKWIGNNLIKQGSCYLIAEEFLL